MRDLHKCHKCDRVFQTTPFCDGKMGLAVHISKKHPEKKGVELTI